MTPTLRKKIKLQTYEFDEDMAKLLPGLFAIKDHKLRMDAMRQMLPRTNLDYLIGFISQLMAMADSVAENCKEQAIGFIVSECDIHPHTAEKLNLPTMFGAAEGYLLSKMVDQTKVCAGCAYRTGSVANQCPGTVCDADYLARSISDDPFMCHENLKDGVPTRKCLGFVQQRAKEAAKQR